MPADKNSGELVIATRESPLALWQAEHVCARIEALAAAHSADGTTASTAAPMYRVRLLGMTTRGDQILDRSLAKVGGKGLFIKELEVALLEQRADLAVHSLKDVPMDLAPEFVLAAVLEREDPRDCMVSARYASLDQLPAGARVGTSSLRRELLLRARYPQLTILPVRGNVGTRLAKLERGEFDALLMAAAGMKRLGHADRIRQILPTAQFLPAPGQGALAIETCAAAPAAAVVAPLEHPATRWAITAERAVSRGLGGSCELPLAAYAEVEPIDGGGLALWLRALAGDAATGRYVAAEARGPLDGAAAPERLARRVVDDLLAAGVRSLLPG